MDCDLCTRKIPWLIGKACSMDGLDLCGPCARIWPSLRRSIIHELACGDSDCRELLRVPGATTRISFASVPTLLIGDLVLTERSVVHIGVSGSDLPQEGTTELLEAPLSFLVGPLLGPAVAEGIAGVPERRAMRQYERMATAGELPSLTDSLSRAQDLRLIPGSELRRVVCESDDFPAPFKEEADLPWTVIVVPVSGIRGAELLEGGLSLVIEGEPNPWEIAFADRSKVAEGVVRALSALSIDEPPAA